MRLEVDTCGTLVDEQAVCLVPIRGLSPTVKSLRVVSATLPPLRIFNLTLSFPLLEDLTVINGYGAPIDNGDSSN